MGAAVLSLIATIGLTALTQAAPGGNSENREAVHQALESGDYQAWSDALANHPKAEEFVNEETFAVLQEAHALKEAGDREGARALLEEAGIQHPGKHRGGENREAMKNAIESGDYQAWAELLADKPNAEEFVNEETFAALQEAHALNEAGDREGAKALLEEAGIKRPGKNRR